MDKNRHSTGLAGRIPELSRDGCSTFTQRGGGWFWMGGKRWVFKVRWLQRPQLKCLSLHNPEPRLAKVADFDQPIGLEPLITPVALEFQFSRSAPMAHTVFGALNRGF
jgi:hypothetical protein